jgi:hypothetical protein
VLALLFLLLGNAMFAQTVDLSTIPASMTLAPNEESSFFVMMDNPANLPIDGVDIYMNFDPASLEILEVQEVFDWALNLNSLLDPTNGVIGFSAGNLQNPPNSSLTLLKIKIRVKSDAVPTSFNFEFDRQSPRQCEVATGGFGVLDQSVSLAIQIIEDCPNIRTITHSPIIDGIFTAGTSIIMSDNLTIYNSAELNAQDANIPASLVMQPGTELRVTPDNCIN